MILIGIFNTGRTRNYSPVRSNGETGEADTLLKFLTDEFKTKKLATIEDRFKKLTERYGFKLEIPEEVIFDMSYQLKRQKIFDGSITMFKTLLERYPMLIKSIN